MVIPLGDVMREIVNTYQDQPREFPRMPGDWIGRVQRAWDHGTEMDLFRLGKELASSHSQYAADWENKPWLAELRVSLRAYAKLI
jgi:hypothetical protein